MANGALFWMALTDRMQLGVDRFRDAPFHFSEIVSVTVYREAVAGREVFTCDWPKLKGTLARVEGICVTPLEAVRPWPSSPPTDALEISVAGA
jgi:hypothetical protein